MRQVPHYLFIGNGRVAKHFQHYFRALNVSFTMWHRELPLVHLHELIPAATHILLLISDNAIDDFIDEHLSAIQQQPSSPLLIHFSGSLVTERAYGAHPLMTFATQLYDFDRYASIPFVLDDDVPDFAMLLPGLPNQHVRMAKSLKAKYHALCVLSGNFSCLLWQKLFTALEYEFHLPAALAYPYLQQQMANLQNNPQSAMTGPLVRGDYQTIERNINALSADPFQQIYQSVVACYEQIKSKENIP